MRVRFYGVRGSIPSPGPTTARYGGNTVCVRVELSDGTTIVCDAGTGMRELGKALMTEGVPLPLHLLLTHVHWDHVIGLPFFAPLYRAETRLNLYPLPNVVQEGRRQTLFDGVHFPVRAEDIPAGLDPIEDTGAVWQIGAAKVTRISLNHPGGAQGFRIDDADGTSLAYLTDNELAPPGAVASTVDEIARFAQGVDLMIHDAQYVPEDMPAKLGWGHSRIDEVLALALQSHAAHSVLFHHDPDRDDATLDRIGEESQDHMNHHGGGAKVTVAYEGLDLVLRR
ncbi:MAG: MBL fold metallo-hydrolase [Polyangiaceae bacterium]|nr:MBL fold metallo-hydrolase [Polyangiaceae bacterium]